MKYDSVVLLVDHLLELAAYLIWGAFWFSALGSISDSDIQHDILSSLRHQRKGHTLFSQLPERLSVSLTGHDKAVNALQWSTTHREYSISMNYNDIFIFFNFFGGATFAYHISTCITFSMLCVQGINGIYVQMFLIFIFME